MHRDWPRWLSPVVLVASVFFALAAWACSSPPGSAPDDDFHLSSIWCAFPSGDTCQLVAAPHKREVGVEQRWLSKAVVDADCYRFHPWVSGACEAAQEATPQPQVPGRVNAGLYPYGYHEVMHLFVGSSVTDSVLLMRLFNGLVAIVFVGAALAVSRHRRAIGLAWGVGLGPLTAFLIASTNPTSWAVIGLGTLWAFLLALFDATSVRRRAVALTGVVASYALASIARADSPVIGSVIVGVCVIGYLPWRRGPWKFGAGVAAAIVLAAAIQYEGSTASRVSAGGLHVAGQHGQGGSRFGLLATNVFHLPDFLMGLFGGFGGLGWLDTPVPAAAVAAYALAAMWIVIAAFRSHGRVRIALTVILVALAAIPLEVLFAARELFGAAVQPRYVLPLFIAALGLAAAAAYDTGWAPRRRNLILVGVALAIANAYALQANEARYTVTNAKISLLLSHGSWSPFRHIPADAVWMLGGLAGLVAWMAAIDLITRTGAERPGSDESAGESPVAAT